jgi:hypothetical protein
VQPSERRPISWVRQSIVYLQVEVGVGW